LDLFYLLLYVCTEFCCILEVEPKTTKSVSHILYNNFHSVPVSWQEHSKQRQFIVLAELRKRKPSSSRRFM